MGGSGVILSQPTLTILGRNIDRCLQFELLTRHEDVELGRCILTHVHIGCTTAYDSKHIFYHHYGPTYEFGSDYSSSIISRAFILHPIKNARTFRQLHAFYLRKEVMSTYRYQSTEGIFTTFLPSIEFNIARDAHYQRLDVRWKYYINDMVQSHIARLQYVWHQHSNNWTIIYGQPMIGYYRVVPRQGLELFVEILLNIRLPSNASHRSVRLRQRVHLSQAFAPSNHLEYREIISRNSSDDDSRLHLVVVANENDDALTRFLDNFQYEILDRTDHRELLTLTIFYYSTENRLNDRLRQLYVRYSTTIHLAMLNQTRYISNRGLEDQLTSVAFTQQQILFFLDIDVMFTGQALMNVRRFMIYHSSNATCMAYFPIVYSSYSSMFAMSHRRWTHGINSRRGSFSIYGFSNVAVRKGNLDYLERWRVNDQEWHVDDINLVQQSINISSDCQIFRSVEPDLRYNYQKKMCHKIQDVTQQRMCSKAQTNLLGSQIDMANYIMKKKMIDE
jgi:hypothetical protein